MNIELVTIGDEILSGAILNSNAAFLSKQLMQAGYQVTKMTTLADEPKHLREGLEQAIKRAELVIATGGLGPTLDDHTRDVAVAIFNDDYHFDEKLAADLKKRYGKNLLSLENQAKVPRKAEILSNSVGTAVGLVFRTEKGFLILLPGVPYEMEEMCTKELLPYLAKHLPAKEKRHVENVHLCLITESEVDLVLRELKKKAPAVKIGIYPNKGLVSVSFSGEEKQEVMRLADALKTEFKTHVFPSTSGKIEEALHNFLIEKKKTLALAESCTGGKIAAHLTALAGASQYFLGSIVSYSNALKHSLLSVPEKSLKEKGAVSSEVVEEMLKGLFKATHADYGIAVSGVAGPTGGSPEHPVGTIWAAVGERGKTPYLFTFEIKGNRAAVLLGTTHRVLSTLWRRISYGI